jgi:anti-anti-sigma factor
LQARVQCWNTWRLSHAQKAPACKEFPKEVVMTIEMCNTTAEMAIAPFESTGSIAMTELVRGNHQHLLELLRPLVRRQSVMLDLASIERIDAAGIAALVSLYTTARDAGNGFTVCNASPRVARILSLFGLDRILISHNAVLASDCGQLLQRHAA